ncbi:ATP-dependent DNA helicase RecQ [Arthrobacter crusticola]|uniref:ATP-dependent DNA helicase RecQ n=1 Tax=Arthrobacter crusticola TaxID=2547960 RepID=A0A4R5U371_9MICC|nr:RecQ family ATP-dependent DNA helicase [Arthrobacter crusticola]TDK28141.1 ATP-dependent DNA helicase RecQ [Arthrobacter crusticola]
MTPVLSDLEETASSVFGWDHLRSGQRQAMQALLEGRNVLCVMPTGSGKSAIYQVPGLVIPGVVVVISPLIALQHDQAEALNASAGAGRAYVVNSGLSRSDTDEAWEAAGEPDEDRRAKFLFLAPEQVAKEEAAERLRNLDVSLLVIDEAHCVSAWGHDFRPDYLQLGTLTDSLSCPVLALTATASAPVQEEITGQLHLGDPVVLVEGFDRPNLFLEVVPHVQEADKHRAVVEQVEGLEKPGLVYVATRKAADTLAEELSALGMKAASYHSGRRASDREEVHEGFLAGRLDVVVATTAFGMGIDKPDVRFVVHEAVADSLDSYYQEIGRGGRDGGPAAATLHYRTEDLSLRRFFAAKTADRDGLEQLFAVLRAQERPTDLKELRALTGLSQRKAAGLMNLLEAAGAVRAGPDGYSAENFPPPEAAERAVEQARIRETIDTSRVEMSRRYAETRGCRRQFLLAYFGEEFDGSCGHCDNCADASSVDCEQQPEAEVPYAVQSKVEHAEWGPGTVMSYEEGTVTVLFETTGYRTLSLDLVAEKGLLRAAG